MIQFDASEVAALAADLRDAAPRATVAAKTVVAKTAFDLGAIAQAIVPVDTGTTKNSIGADIDGLIAVIGPTTSYAPPLEFGTYKMAPRPFMGPAADQVEPGFIEAMRQLGAEAISR